MPTLAIALAILAAVLLAAFVLFGARIDGRRQALLQRGQHPTTTDAGDVVAEEIGPDVHPANYEASRAQSPGNPLRDVALADRSNRYPQGGG